MRDADKESMIRRLLRRAQTGDREAREALLRATMGLVIHFAKRFYRPGLFLEMEDLVQQGCLGLLTAMDKFDLKRRSHPHPPLSPRGRGRRVRGPKVRFATYARWWIEHAIRREIANRGRTIAVPVKMQQKINQERRRKEGYPSPLLPLPQGARGRKNEVPSPLGGEGGGEGFPKSRFALKVVPDVIPLEKLSEDDELIPNVTSWVEPDPDDPEIGRAHV